MKKLIFGLLAVALLCTGCQGDSLSQGGSTEAITKSEAGTIQKEIVLASGNQASFQIIVPEVCSAGVINAAEKLKNKLTDLTGAIFTVVDDYTRNGEAIDSTGEIIIGNCKRTEMQNALLPLSYRDYSVLFTDSNILIAGYEDEKVIDAVYDLIQRLEAAEMIQTDNEVILKWAGDFQKIYAAYPFDDMTLGGISVREYRIVYPAGEYEERYLESALSVQNSIGKYCGAVLRICSDASQEQPYEILIGQTNRSDSRIYYESAAAPSGMEYGISIQNQKIIVASGGLYTLPFATDLFEERMDSVTDGVLDQMEQNIVSLINQPIPQAKGEYRLMTYNILVEYSGWGSGGTIPPPVELRKEIVSTLILQYQPDVVGLQEVFDNWHDQLPELIDEDYAYVCMDRTDGEPNRSPIIYNKHRLKVVYADYVDIEDTLTQNRRVVTWAVLEDMETQQRFAVLCTHWDAHYQENRLKQAKRMAELVHQIQDAYGDLPVFALGDFNCVPTREEFIAFLNNSGLKNASEMNGYDHIFCSPNVTVLMTGAERSNCAQYASDHYPVWIDVVLNENT